MDNKKEANSNQEQILIHTKQELEKQKTMTLSIKEGSASSVMSGFGDAYISPYALAINANNLQIGLLSSFIGILGPISQVYGSSLMGKYSRKKIVFVSVILHGLMWFPMLLLSLFFWKGIFINHLATILIIFYSIYTVFGAIAGPAWFSLLGDIVPERIRGRYFSKRNRICGAVALVTTLIGAFILDYFKTKGLILVTFSALFFIAGIARFIAAYYFKKHYDPGFKFNKADYFSFFQFMKKAPNNNFGKFVIYVALFYFGVQIGGPFFTVYMLKNLGLNYIQFTLINISASFFSLLTLPMWGKFSDKYGNRTTLQIGGVLVGLMPIAWIFSDSFIYLIIVPQLLSGIGWAAFNLSASNFIYDSVSPQKRGLCVAYYNLLMGIGIFIGATLGGFLANYLHITFMNILTFLFLISGIIRLASTLFMLPKIKEVRKVVHTKNYFYRFRDMRPLRELFFELMDLGVIKLNLKKGAALILNR